MSLLFEIAPRYFVDKQFFVVDFDPVQWDRKSFVEFGPLEGEAAEKKHVESGSPIAWTGAGTINYSNITMKRGVGLNAPPGAPDNGVLDTDMEDWWQAVVDGIDPGGNNFKRNCTVTEMSRDGQPYGFSRRVLDMVPVKYKPFEGDSNSDEVQMEELEAIVSRWFRDTADAFGTA